MPKFNFTVSSEAAEALKRIAEKRSNVPMAVLLREAVELYLEQQGEKVDVDVQWGGKRDVSKED